MIHLNKLIVGFLIGLLMISCHDKKIWNGKTETMARERGNYKSYVNLLIHHSEMNSFFIKTVDSVLIEPENYFENGKYKLGNRVDLKPTSGLLIDFVLFDLMEAEQYLIPISQIKDKEILWHWLSVFVENNNILNTRQHLTDEIYDNPEYIFDIEKSSLLFNASEYLIFSVDMIGVKSIGTIKRINFTQLELICKKLNYKLKELK